MNKLTLIGNVTRDFETSKVATKRGKQDVANFDIAVNGPNNTTTFFKATAWDKAAVVLAKYAKKGTKVMLAGPVGYEVYNDRVKLTIRVDDFEFCSPRAQIAEADSAPAVTYNPDVAASVDMGTGEIVADEDNEDLPW